jgi:hypothetical protein
MELIKTQTTGITKAYIGKTGCAVIKCMFCEYTKHVKVPERFISRPVRVKCKCGESFLVLFDARSHFRKFVELPGEITMALDKKRAIKVITISRKGIGFKLGLSRPEVEIGDVVTARFRLDNHDNSWIDTNITITRIDGNHIGAEFTNLEVHDKKVIGFYLME